MPVDVAKGNDSARWQDILSPGAPSAVDVSLIYENAPPRRIQIMGTVGTLKLERHDGTFLTFSASSLNAINGDLLAACYVSLDAAGSTCTDILVSW